jgi:hypothetical protein
MVGSLPLNLILSLVFGVGQIAVGGWIAVHTLRQRSSWRQGVMVCVGLWFVVSGVVELLVSGMEASQRLTGAPAAAVFELWRARGDTALAVATVALACGAIAYPLVLRWRVRNGVANITDARAETSVEGEPRA